MTPKHKFKPGLLVKGINPSYSSFGLQGVITALDHGVTFSGGPAYWINWQNHPDGNPSCRWTENGLGLATPLTLEDVL